MSRRNRTDSEKGLKEIYDGAQIVIDPPLKIKLGNGVRPYWDLLVKSKAARAWQEQDLILLVELSRNLCKTEKLSLALLDESEIIETAQGVKANPSFGVLDQLVKRARMIYAMLQIHPEATQGKSNRQVDQNKKHSSARDAIDEDGSDDLIPQPGASH